MRRIIRWIFMIGFIGMIGVWICNMWMQIPASISIRAGETQSIHFSIPATGEISVQTLSYKLEKPKRNYRVDLAREVSFFSDDRNTYQLNVKLFGVIPFKQTSVSVVENTQVIPCGKPIGIFVKTDGILVIDTGEFLGADGGTYEPTSGLLKAGDYILSCDGKPLSGKRELMEIVEACEGRALVLSVRRNDATFQIRVCPEKDESGEYKLGIWIRDNAQGVGTVTYLDKEGRFGALGHGINDMDTSILMELADGSILRTEIINIQKGISGTPGELTGMIRYNEENYVGEITDNTNVGIFGEVTDVFLDEQESSYMNIALKQEVKTGPAQIINYMDGEEHYYDVEITNVHLNAKQSNKAIELKVTDAELLNKTGGIVQGMSGSPIVQDGKIIGAVTHVLVNDPTKGYGIFLETMLNHGN